MCVKTSIELVTIEGKKVAISIIETTTKNYKPGSYNKIINDLIHDYHWRVAIKKTLQNLKSHKIWKYKELLLR